MINEVLFDIDGAFFDLRPLLLQSLTQYFSRRYGIQLSKEDFIPFADGDDRTVVRGVLGKYPVMDEYESIMKEIAPLEERLLAQATPLNGSLRFFRNCKKSGLKTILVHCSSKQQLSIALGLMGLGEGDFDQVAYQRRENHGKSLIDAALVPSECLAVESSLVAIGSAKNAGALVCGVVVSHDAETLSKNGADIICTSLGAFEDFSTIEQFNSLLRAMQSTDDNRVLYGMQKVIPCQSKLFNLQEAVKLAIEEATKVRENAYAPYSHYKVGAAIVSAGSGVVYSGCNVENSSFGATICAERNAVLHAVACEGTLGIEALVVVSGDNPPAPPCAQCLQVLAEFCKSDTEVHLVTVDHTVHLVYHFSQLLPYPFVLAGRN